MSISDPQLPATASGALRYDYGRHCFVREVAGEDVDLAWHIDLMPEIVQGITGMCSREQAEALFDLARQANPRGVMVEVGSLEGYTAIYLAWGSRCGSGQPLYCVDPHEGDLGVRRVSPTWDAFVRNVRRAGVAEIVRPVRQPSVAAAAGFDRPISLCYIDAMHDYESVRLDLDSWSVHLLDGAVVAFDDAVDDFPGVLQLERELRDGTGNFVYQGRLGVGFYGRWQR